MTIAFLAAPTLRIDLVQPAAKLLAGANAVANGVAFAATLWLILAAPGFLFP